ncbi:MAG: hypothetical protein AB1642_10240 [Pseudomonadota bacterium]
MARADPAEQALIRLEMRRFASRCDQQEGQIRRADTLREVARLASIAIPYKVANEIESRDFQRRVLQVAEERAREIIDEQISIFVRAEPSYREKQRGKMREDWANLTGVLAHLRNWAQNKLNVAEQNNLL